MLSTQSITSHIKPIAQAGLTAKGIVYCLLGVLTFMAAFHINGQSADDANTNGVFSFLYRQTGGRVILGIIALGLVCYCIWRCIQTFADTEDKGRDKKGIAVRARYLFSGLAYATLAFSIVRMLWFNVSGGGDSKQNMARELLNQPAGQWLLGIAALVIAAIGMYQIYYGWSEKYKKHVDKVINDSNKRKILLGAGKIGYVSRGIVWLLIAWLFINATIDAKASEAGDTSKAFTLIEKSEYGSLILATMGFGLICYGIFSFIRAKYEDLG